MEINLDKKEIILDRKINDLDKFVIDFCKILEKYVLVSGYVSILFGRSRSTEDVDLLIPKMSKERFLELFNNLVDNGYECANSMNPEEAYEMLEDFAIRFFKKGKPIPNIEFKIIKDELGMYVLEEKLKVEIGKEKLFISPIEVQIAYKLFLAADGTKEEILIDKDIEDARFLFKLFEEKINKDTLAYFLNKFGVRKKEEFLK